MKLEDLKKEYNKTLARFYKAEAWFEDPKNYAKNREKYLGEFQKILKKLSKLLNEIQRREGRELTIEEKFKGFKLTNTNNKPEQYIAYYRRIK